MCDLSDKLIVNMTIWTQIKAITSRGWKWQPTGLSLQVWENLVHKTSKLKKSKQYFVRNIRIEVARIFCKPNPITVFAMLITVGSANQTFKNLTVFLLISNRMYTCYRGIFWLQSYSFYNEFLARSFWCRNLSLNASFF